MSSFLFFPPPSPEELVNFPMWRRRYRARETFPNLLQIGYCSALLLTASISTVVPPVWHSTNSFAPMYYCCFMAMMGKKVKVETIICFTGTVLDYDNS